MPEARSCLAAALWYARERGWAVLPVHWLKSSQPGSASVSCSCGKPDCGSPGKHPLVKHGSRDASKDPAQIETWWSEWPEANVGIATGVISGIWVLDVDPRHGGDDTLRDLEKIHGALPYTPMVLTGGGGVHYIFELPTDCAIMNRASFVPGNDARGEGGYVVGAPSKHASGRFYEWEIDHRPEAVLPSQAPEWLVGLALGRAAGTPGAPAGRPLAPPLPSRIPEGGRDNALTQFAGAMRRKGASEEAILAALRVENREKCVPPLDESDLIRISKSVSRYTPGDPVTGEMKDVPLEDRSTIGAAILKELPGKSQDQLLSVLEDQNAVAALVAARRLEPGLFAATMERLKPRSLQARFERVTKAGVKLSKTAEARREREKQADPRPEICISMGDLEDHVSLAAKFLTEKNAPPAARALYWRAGRISRVRYEDRVPAIEVMNEKAMVEALAQAIHWTAAKSTDDGGTESRDVYPPKEVASSLIERPNLGLPTLSALYTHPVMIPSGLDGGAPHPLLSGYHPQTGILVSSPFGADWSTLPTAATQDEARESARWMRDEVFCDFPFESDAELATAYAFALLPFVRPLVEGATPLHLLEASSPGSGKGLLVDACAFFATGGHGVSLGTQAENEEEWRKSITAKLSEGSEIIQIDNATGHLDSAALCAVLSTPDYWSDRRLGRNDQAIRVPARALWVITANNLSLSHDLSRRTVRCRLVPKDEKPYRVDQRKFRHASLRTWMRKSKGEMLKHAWRAVLAWAQAGAPLSSGPIKGTFESWSVIMGGLLAFLAVPGFLANEESILEAADRDAAPMREFVRLWFFEHREDAVTTDHLLSLAMKSTIGVRGTDEASRKRSLSWILRQNRDRIFRGWKISQDARKDTDGRVFWKLEAMTEQAEEDRKNAPPRPNPFATSGPSGAAEDRDDQPF